MVDYSRVNQTGRDYPSLIYTLVSDIEAYISKNEDWYEHVENLLHSGRSVTHVGDNRQRRGLRLSGLGDKCPRQLWYSVHLPELAEKLPAHARFKYGYGHTVEKMVIALAKLAGHEVTGEQDELVVDGVVGHRDCVIDGAVVDVKSCSSLAFRKYKEGSLSQSDDFGYLYQLGSYVLGSEHDALVTVKDRGYLFFVDKSLGHMYLYESKVDHEKIKKRIEKYRQIVGEPSPPACACVQIQDGKSGNLRLDVKASYNPFKYQCFPDLRVFLYSDGPRYLTKVERTPEVPEIKR